MFISCIQALKLLKGKPIMHKSPEYNFDCGIMQDSTWLETVLDYSVEKDGTVNLLIDTNGRVHGEQTQLGMIYFDMTRLEFVNAEDKPKYWDLFYDK